MARTVPSPATCRRKSGAFSGKSRYSFFKGSAELKHLKCFSLLLTLSLLCVSVCGCAQGTAKDPQELLRSVNFVTASEGDLLFTLELTEAGGIYRFSAPELLRSLTVTVTDGTVHAAYEGLETDVTDAYCAGILPLCRAIHALRTVDADRGGQGKQSYLRTTLDADTFLLYYDPDSGIATRMEWTGANGTGGLDILSCTKSDS